MTISGRKKVTPSVFDTTDIPLMARVNGLTNIPLVQATVSALTVNVYAKGATPGTPTSLTPISTYVYNTLQTADAAWTEDATGYNIKYELPSASIPAEGIYYVDLEATSSGKKIVWGFEVNVVGR
jgi:hypothetical protein